MTFTTEFHTTAQFEMAFLSSNSQITNDRINLITECREGGYLPVALDRVCRAIRRPMNGNEYKVYKTLKGAMKANLLAQNSEIFYLSKVNDRNLVEITEIK